MLGHKVKSFLILNKSEYHSANVRGAGGSLVMRQARERYMRDGYRHTERGVQTRSPIRQSRSVSQSIIFPGDMADSRGLLGKNLIRRFNICRNRCISIF
jgi:hypothetical protein